MRIMIKGGVWKNTEDEILKAAVMKYGKNQWARISSLLVRKSAKQCKARWFEWLDPSIKKTEWTREEEEKLLHLAKIMPTQWRTIAPIIGRTSSQCLERYEKLLDAAQRKSGGAADEDRDDPRRLRPGEIDPNPEAKPARPDPVDMDEDEKEMLSEARARLANTQGKKAKRKAREKQLEEARRLAQLQKRREMREAGIVWHRQGPGLKRKRKWGVDYNLEIPFYKKAPKGYFDVSEEKDKGYKIRENTNFLGKTVEQINSERRDVIEERERKKDARRQKMHRKHNLKEHLLRVNKMNDVPTMQHRAEMILPAPQLNDNELEQISKMGGIQDGVDKSAPTSTLVGDYNQTPQVASRTPVRTPMSRDTVMEEAQNIINLRNTNTPLLGGENAAVDMNFKGVTPQRSRLSTPNPLATPSRGMTTPGRATPMGSATPGSAVSGSVASGVTGATGLTATPARDHLGINADGSMDAATVLQAKKRIKALRRKMKTGFGKLPKAKNKYSIVLPELPPDIDEDDDVEEDAEDAAALREARAKAKEALNMKKRSQALQRGLPRPLAIGNLRFASDDQGEELRMIHEEMDRLVRHDEAKYEIKGAMSKRRKLVEIEDFSLAEIDRARKIIDDEVQKHLPEDAVEAFNYVWEECTADVMFLPTKKQYGKLSEVSKKDQLAAIKQEFELTRQHLAKDTKKAQKITQKLNIMLGGYHARSQKLSKKINRELVEAERQQRDGRCFAELMAQEEAALPARLKTIEQQLAAEAEKESGAQSKYAKLSQEKEELMAELKIVNEII